MEWTAMFSDCASFPNPTIEAMACGIPVVASNRGAIPEITDGAAVLVEDPKSSKEMAQAVRTVLEDARLRDGLVKQGLRRAQDFSWEKSTRKVFDVYREIGSAGKNSGSSNTGLPRS